MPVTDPSLVDRYGAPSHVRRRVGWGLVAVTVLVLSGWFAWVVYDQVTPEVSSDNLRFDVEGPRSVTASFDVEIADGVQATCTVRAYAEDHTLVGTRSFTPVPDASGLVEVSVATERQATSVELIGCTSPGQKRPR